jgi:uncharacterized membrane protein
VLPDRISIEQFRSFQAHDKPIVMVDTRSDRSFAASERIVLGAIHAPADRAVAVMRAQGVPQDAWIVTYCT